MVDAGADIGLAFDGDADRCFVVDADGNPVSPSAITALIAVRELARNPGAAIIHNLITSRAVPEIIAEHGGRPVRTRVGPLAHQGRDGAHAAPIFGGEHSAHYYFQDFWRADTGMLAAMHVLAALGEQDRPARGTDRAVQPLRRTRARSIRRWPRPRRAPMPSGRRSPTAPGPPTIWTG